MVFGIHLAYIGVDTASVANAPLVIMFFTASTSSCNPLLGRSRSRGRCWAIRFVSSSRFVRLCITWGGRWIGQWRTTWSLVGFSASH